MLYLNVLLAPVGRILLVVVVIIAVVTLQTFYVGKHDLLTVYLGKLDFLSVTDFSLGTWICLENNRVSLDSYPKAIAREK